MIDMAEKTVYYLTDQGVPLRAVGSKAVEAFNHKGHWVPSGERTAQVGQGEHQQVGEGVALAAAQKLVNGK